MRFLDKQRQLLPVNLTRQRAPHLWMMQIFSRNPRGSNYKDPTVKEAEEFQRIRREAGFGAILAHATLYDESGECEAEVYEFRLHGDPGRCDADGQTGD